MHSYLAIQGTYHNFEMALFFDNNLQDQVIEDKRHVSKLFIVLLEDILKRNATTLEDLSFIAINQGPGLFSTLRSIIASVNALHFATHIPLVGIDGLEATALQFYNSSYKNTVVLLNAFNDEVYYAIMQNEHFVQKGYKKIDVLLQELQHTYAQQHINFFGNGAILYHDCIKNIFNADTIISQNIDQCSIEYIGLQGLKQFTLPGDYTKYLFPLYLKKHPVEINV